MSEPVGPFAEVVLGALDVEATVEFLGLFDLVPAERLRLGPEEAAELYGLDEVRGDAVRLVAPGAEGRASVLVVPSSRAADAPGAWQAGPRALDLYSADLDRSLALASAAGWAASPEAVLAGGPMRMRQALVRGPEQLPVVLVDSTHRRSSICDGPDSPLHSEPHSVVWVVEDHAAELDRWVRAGWTAGATISFSEPTVSDELGLPERPTPITMTMLSDPRVEPIRLELMSFDDHPEPVPSGPAGPARGLHALAVTVPSLDAARAAWGADASFGPTVVRHDERSAALGRTVGGVQFVLVEQA